MATIESVTKDRDHLGSIIRTTTAAFRQHGLDQEAITSLSRIYTWMDDQIPALRRRYQLTIVSDQPYPGHHDMVKIDESAVFSGPVGLALRLMTESDGMHPINISSDQMAAIKAEATRTGISENLLLSIVWQEQQWYQNVDPGLDSGLIESGRTFDWTLEQSVKPDKSLGITHMKISTARRVMTANRGAFTTGDKFLGDLNDSQLSKYIEENPDFDIRLSAQYLADLKKSPAGAGSDKQLFLLYAADTPQVRQANEQYGDATAPRGAAIRNRAENWDRLQPVLKDAQGWASLPDSERKAALAVLGKNLPTGQHLDLSPVYTPEGVETTVYGSGPVPPGTPSPASGPPPTPPQG